MIPKSCRLFGQDHATKQVIRAKWRFDSIPFRSSEARATIAAWIGQPPDFARPQFGLHLLRSVARVERQRNPGRRCCTAVRGFHSHSIRATFAPEESEEARMRNRLRRARFANAAAAAAVAATLMTALQLCAIPAASAAEAYRAPRTADGKAALNGIWQVLNTANWDLQQHAAQSGPVVALGAAGAVPAGLGV